ncbi:MAG: hypothetical protein V4565_14660 [Bacteroidota bacterium]
MKFLFWLLILTLLLSMQCQKRGDMNLYITNNSNKTLILKITERANDTLILSILPGDYKRKVRKITNFAPSPRKIKECICNYSSIQISPSDNSFIILKDINNPDNWNKKLVKGSFTKSPDYSDCFFEINQGDIQ